MNKKIFIKTISFAISIILILESGIKNSSDYVYADGQYEPFLSEDELLEVNDNEEYYISQDSDGFVNIIDNEPVENKTYDFSINQRVSSYGDVDLPSKYSSVLLNRVTSVKNQGSYPNCWAFSTVGAMETSLLCNDNSISNNIIDISETRLIYDFYHRENMIDPLGNTEGDYTYAKKSVWYNNMGNQQLAVWPLINGEGAFDEDTDNDYSLITEYNGNEEDYFDGDYYIREASFFEEYNKATKADDSTDFLSPETENAMKKYIMDEGSIIVGIKSSSIYDSSSDSTYSFDPNEDKASHAVLIVGWDDTIDRKKFNKNSLSASPKRDGAWLVKNSYGTGSGACKADGVSGYFWLSYDDKTISSITGISAAKKDEYDHIFYYDGGTGLKSVKVSPGKPVYNIYKNNTEHVQRIKEIGIGIKTASYEGREYRYQIYKSPNPENEYMGTPLLSDYQYGVNYFGGYHTDKLNEEVLINPGENFSVVYYFTQETSIYIDKEDSNTSWYGVKVGEEVGANYSFYNFMDLSTYSGGPITLRIKAYSIDDEASKDDPNKDDSGKDDSGKDDSGKDDSGKDDSGKDDTDKDDSDKDDSQNDKDNDGDNSKSQGKDANQDEIEYEDYIKYCKDGIPNGVWFAGLDTETKLIYDGTEKKPEIRVYDYNKKLVINRDYELEYNNNINANESSIEENAPRVTVNFKGDYQGSKIYYFQILPKELSDSGYIIKDIVKKYTGKRLDVSPVICDAKGVKLRKNRDYKYNVYKLNDGERSLVNDIYDKGLYEIEISGTGNYTGNYISKLTVYDDEMDITDIGKARVKGLNKKMTYTGEAIYQDNISLLGPDGIISSDLYEVHYINNKLPGKATIIINANGSDSKVRGTKIIKFNIKGYSLKKCKVKYDKKINYSNSINNQVKITNANGVILVENIDYTLDYELSKNGRKVKLIIKGINKYTGNIKKTFTISKYDISLGIVTYGEKVSADSSNKKSKTWVSVSISDNGVKLLREGKDYIIKFYNTKKSNYFVIKGIGNYKGTIGNRENKFIYGDYKEDINKVSLSKVSADIKDKEYSAGGVVLLKEDIRLTINNHELIYDKDYKINGYLNNFESGKAKVFIEGTGDYTGVYMYEFNINSCNILNQ